MDHMLAANTKLQSVLQKMLWASFCVYAVCIIFGVLNVFKGDLFWQIVTFFPLLILALHACLTLSVKRGLAFIFLASSVGFIAEAFGIKYGTVFGGQYVYEQSATFFTVPIGTILYWAIFIYLGYWLVTTFRYWLGKAKPQKGQTSYITLAATIIADGLAVTALDLFMDPVKVHAGAWTWLEGGLYFGVPLGNFVGWFLVTVTVTGLFRWFEYNFPLKQAALKPSIYILPVAGYLLAGLAFLAGAISYHLPSLAVIGTLVVIVPALINIGLFLRFQSKARK